MNELGPFKIVILGEGRVGKTSILRRYVEGVFQDGERSTQRAAYLEKVVALTGKRVHLALWDTAGQERFHSLAPIYYRDADAALLVYDVTDLESFRRVAKWVGELRISNTLCPIAIVGNKADLKPERVPQADVEEYAKQNSARYTRASARTGTGIDDTFKGLIEDMLKFKQDGPGLDSLGGDRSFALVSEGGVAQRGGRRKRGGCCGGGGEQY